MGISYGCYIIEHFDDQAPEPFGHMTFDRIPSVGERVTLKWLNGTDAHNVVVTKVDGQTLHVKAAK